MCLNGFVLHMQCFHTWDCRVLIIAHWQDTEHFLEVPVGNIIQTFFYPKKVMYNLCNSSVAYEFSTEINVLQFKFNVWSFPDQSVFLTGVCALDCK